MPAQNEVPMKVAADKHKQTDTGTIRHDPQKACIRRPM